MYSDLISIVMPVRNAGEFLEACLKSIQEQSYANWELIAINDHSNDGSEEILELFSAKDSRIKWLNNDGNGIIDALNLAYSNTNGNYISRMDADDLMPVNKLDTLHKALKSKGSGAVATGLVEYFSETQLGNGYLKYANWLNGLTSSSSNFTEIYKECVIPSPCWMMHKEDLEACGGFDSTIYPEDYDLCFRMYKHNLRVVGVNEVMHLWRDHGQRASRNDDNYSDNRFLAIKLKYFLELDYNPQKELVVWGAGKKGKEVAKYLNKAETTFTWVCDNPKKIGLEIYGRTMEDCRAVNEKVNCQVLVLVANEEAQETIKKDLSGNDEVYWFC